LYLNAKIIKGTEIRNAIKINFLLVSRNNRVFPPFILLKNNEEISNPFKL